MQLDESLVAVLRRQRELTNLRPLSDEFTHRMNQLTAVALLVAFAPLMVVVAFLIWRSKSGSIFFGHYRVGQTGQLFKCFKFRSMVANADTVLQQLLDSDPKAREEWDRDQKLTHDPRITAVGHFLRRTSLDELPQLFNVVRGEMNLVGPRPITVNELIRYGSIRWHYFSVRPGMTGLWQVSGRNNTTYEQRVELDAEYVKNRSLVLDFLIMLKTIKVVIARDGAK